MNVLLLALVPACFALNPVIGRAMVDTLGPATLSIIRWAFSAGIIALLAFARGQGLPSGVPLRHLVRVALLGAMAMGFCAYAAFEGARTSPATNVALIYGCTSAFVAAWEIAAGRQRATAPLLLGITACLAGVVLIVTRGHPEVLGSLRFTPGDVWATAGMLVFVIYTVLLRRTPALLTPLVQFVVMSTAATIALVPAAALELGPAVPALEAWMLPWLLALVLATGIGAFLGYNVALERNGPVLTSAALTLTPLYAAAMAMVLVGERLAWYHAVALVLVMAGLLLVNRGQSAAAKKIARRGITQRVSESCRTAAPARQDL